MMKANMITVGLVGNPNCGKSTIFNALTGLHQKTANWSGVTIEKKEGSVHFGEFEIKVVDLPGIYSLTAYSIEEIIARNYIIHEQPDVIVNVVDAGNLERNLYLTTQLINIGVRVILALNMYDEVAGKGIEIDTEKMGMLLGMPVVRTVGTKGEGIRDLLSMIVSVATEKEKTVRHIHIDYGEDIESEIRLIQKAIRIDAHITTQYSTRWLALRLIEDDCDVVDKLKECGNFDEIIRQAKQSRETIEKKYGDEIPVIMAERRQGFIAGLLEEVTLQKKEIAPNFSERVDRVLMNKYLGYPILLFFLWMLFQATYTLGEYPRSLIENGVQRLAELVRAFMPDGFFRQLIADGVIAGVGGVIVFLPNILILFMGVSFMEDTGYMARAAFIMDKIMHRLGIHGKSFIPLVMGFGCNVPAIMATRTLESRRDRIITVLINPFMSCSARLPVYVLFAGVFFADYAGSVILSLYLVGMLMAFLSSKIFSRVLSQEKSAPFVMELPPYRLPTARAILFHMWNRSSQYLRKMGGIILIFAVIVWFLSSFPRQSPSAPIASQHETRANEQRNVLRQSSTNSASAEHSTIANTYMGRLGKMVEPALSPLGFTCQMGVALLTGIVAKEVVISTLNIFYTEEHHRDARPASLEEALKRDPHVSPLSAYVYMLFVLLYIPCIATTVAIGREIGWRWAFFSIAYNLTLTWAVCFAVYRIGMVVLSV